MIRHIERVHNFSHPLSDLESMSSSVDTVGCNRCGLEVTRGDNSSEFRVRYIGEGRPRAIKKTDFAISTHPCV